MFWPAALTAKLTIMKLANLMGKVLFAWGILTCQTGFTQHSSTAAMAAPSAENVKVVKAWYTAFEKKDWNSMQGILANGFTFSSPLDDHINVAAFKERCWPNAYHIRRFEVDKFVVNGDSAFVITNGWTTSGKLFRNSDFFKLKDGKIVSYECFFGPGVNYPNSGK